MKIAENFASLEGIQESIQDGEYPRIEISMNTMDIIMKSKTKLLKIIETMGKKSDKELMEGTKPVCKMIR